MLKDLKAELESLYIQIAESSKEEVEALSDKASKLEDEIENIENPPSPPMSLEEWERVYDVRKVYERFSDEYGDAAAFYSDYRHYHYQIYFTSHKRGAYYSL